MKQKKGNASAEMSFWDHIEELRGTLFRSVGVLLVFFVVLFFFKEFIFDKIVLAPTRQTFWFYRLLGTSISMDLINIEVSAQFFIHIKVTFILAFIISFPLICYEAWKFVAPALYENEKATMRKAFGLGAVLFYSGLAVGYFIVLPVILFFFQGYQVSAAVQNTFSLGSYISLFSSMTLMMGILFEFPSVIAVLSHFGLVDRSFLRRYRRHAIVIILILAAVLTPTGDPFSMLVVAFPLYILFELSILLCKKGEDAPKDEPQDDIDQ